jgi:hypothetical protein
MSEPNDPALSSMQVERGTFANESTESVPIPEAVEEPSQEILTSSLLVRSPSKRASQVFKFLLDAPERAPTPSSFQTLSSIQKEPTTKVSTPSNSQLQSSVFINREPSSSGSSSGFKPLPTPPPSFPANERLRSMNFGPRMPHEQRLRGGSLPLLSIEQFNQQFPDDEDDEDESVLFTPSRPSKKPALQLGIQSVPPLPTPSASTSSRDGSYIKKQSQHSRQRSQTLTQLDNPYLTSLSITNTRSSTSLSQRPSGEMPKPSVPSNHLGVPGRDFMASLRQRTRSAVGSIVSLSKPNKRYSDRFVAIEWEHYSRS